MIKHCINYHTFTFASKYKHGQFHENNSFILLFAIVSSVYVQRMNVKRDSLIPLVGNTDYFHCVRYFTNVFMIYNANCPPNI